MANRVCDIIIMNEHIDDYGLQSVSMSTQQYSNIVLLARFCDSHKMTKERSSFNIEIYVYDLHQNGETDQTE